MYKLNIQFGDGFVGNEIVCTTTTAIFISCPEKFTTDKYMQREKLAIKIEHSHLIELSGWAKRKKILQ